MLALFFSSSEDEPDFFPPIVGKKPTVADQVEQASILHEKHDDISKEDVNEFDEMGARLAAEELDDEFHERVRAWTRLEQLSSQLQEEDDRQLDLLDPLIQDVLIAAGDSGPHLAFLDYVLHESGYDQRKEIMDSVKNGFIVSGNVPVEYSNKPRLVCRQTVKPEDRKRGEQAWKDLVNNTTRPRGKTTRQ